MPLFPGERPLTPQEVASEEFTDIALSYFSEQTGLRREEAAFSVHIADAGGDVGPLRYFIARPLQPVLGPTQQRYPDPNRWWIFDADVDETEGWRAQGTIAESGNILFNGVECGGGFVMGDGFVTRIHNAIHADEGDEPGPPPPPRLTPDQARRQAILQGGGLTRRLTPQEEQMQRQQGLRFGNDPPPMVAQAPRERLPRGNSSVRDAVAQMRELNAKDATYEDDESLGEVMLGANFVRPTTSTAYQPPEEGFEPDPTMADVVGTDINGDPIIARRSTAPKTVYDHMSDNLKELRAKRPVPSVWDRLAAQRKGK